LEGPRVRRAAACAKHFLGYSAPKKGLDRADRAITEQEVHQYYLRPWERAVKEAGVLTVMESYGDLQGVLMASNAHYLKRVLRQQLGFTGLLVTDYAEIRNLVEWHSVARDYGEAVRLAMEETFIDVSMAPPRRRPPPVRGRRRPDRAAGTAGGGSRL